MRAKTVIKVWVNIKLARLILFSPMHLPAIAIEPNVSITYNANDNAVIGQTIPIAENAYDDIK